MTAERRKTTAVATMTTLSSRLSQHRRQNLLSTKMAEADFGHSAVEKKTIVKVRKYQRPKRRNLIEKSRKVLKRLKNPELVPGRPEVFAGQPSNLLPRRLSRQQLLERPEWTRQETKRRPRRLEKRHPDFHFAASFTEIHFWLNLSCKPRPVSVQVSPDRPDTSPARRPINEEATKDQHHPVRITPKKLRLWFRAGCHMRFQCAFTACCCFFQAVTLAGSNLSNYACSKLTLKARVVIRLCKQASSV